MKDLKKHETIPDLELYLSKIRVTLFEYDKRFEIYGTDFIFYDYKDPLNFKEELSSHFDLIVADPPYLASECQIKTGMTIRKIGKQDLKLIVCTGK